MKKFIVFITLLTFCLSINADAANKVAQTGVKMLDVGMGARACGMGEAFTVLGQDASALFYNPAGVGEIEGNFDLYAGQTQWIADISYINVAGVYNAGVWGKFGFSLITPDYGEFYATRVDAAAELLVKAERPLMVAGGGALYSRDFKQVKELAETLDMPVMTTPCGRGTLPEDHPLAFGQVGLYFSRLGERMYGEVDLLMTVGSRNEDFQSGRQQFFPEGAKYIQIDIDPHEIGRNWIPDVPIVGDASMVLGDLLECVKQRIGNTGRKGLGTTAAAYGISSVPPTVLVNKNGIVVKKIEVEDHAEGDIEQIERMLGL